LSNPTRKGTFRANIEDVIYDIFVATSTDNVYMEDGRLLSEYLVELATKEDIKKAIDELIDGAPEILDTLKEIAEYIQQHGDIIQMLQDLIEEKADKAELELVIDNLNTLANDFYNSPTIYYSVETPERLKAGDMWVRPVLDASVLKTL